MKVDISGLLPSVSKNQAALERSTVIDQRQSLTSSPAPSQGNLPSSSVVVHIGEAPKVSLPLYPKESLTERVVTDFSYEDEDSARFALTKQLGASANGPFSVAGYLSQIGQLSGETDDFNNTARSYLVSSSFASQALDSDFEKRALSRSATFDLELKTKDGDTITITLAQDSIGGSGRQAGVSLSFSVDGELSEEEQAALDDFAQSIAKTADGFFKGEGAKLQDLSFVNKDVFSEFTLELRARNTGKTFSGFVRYEYQLDERTNVQSLNAEINGYQFELSTSLNNPFEISDLANNANFQKYLSLIEEAGKAYGTEQAEIDFLVDGFSSLMLSTPGAAPREDYNELRLRGDDSIDGFFTGVADFNAKFTSDVSQPNPQVPGEVNLMALELGQKTDIRTFITADGFHEVFTQTFTHELDIRKHEAPQGLTLIDFEDGNYRYVTSQYSETQLRTLERVDGLMTDLALERSIEETFTSKEVYLWEVTEHFVDSKSSYSKASLIELDQKMRETAQLMAELEKLLDDNTVVITEGREDIDSENPLIM